MPKCKRSVTRFASRCSKPTSFKQKQKATSLSHFTEEAASAALLRKRLARYLTRRTQATARADVYTPTLMVLTQPGCRKAGGSGDRGRSVGGEGEVSDLHHLKSARSNPFDSLMICIIRLRLPVIMPPFGAMPCLVISQILTFRLWTLQGRTRDQAG